MSIVKNRQESKKLHFSVIAYTTGVGLVRFKSTEERTLVAVGAVQIPPPSFRETTIVLRSAVGVDVRVGRGWAVRYSFSEFIGPNPIGRRGQGRPPRHARPKVTAMAK